MHSSSDSSRGCARRLIEEWTLAFPDYSTTANALMKRVKLIKSHPKTAQASNSQATAEVEGSCLPNSPATRGLAAEESGPNITTSAVGSEGELTGTPTDPQGESEEVSMDSDLGLEELVRKVNQHHQAIERYQLKREEKYQVAWGLRGRQAACSDQPVDARSETQNILGGQLHGVCCSFNPQPQKSPESAPRVQGRQNEKCLRFMRLIAWLDVEITRQKQDA